MKMYVCFVTYKDSFRAIISLFFRNIHPVLQLASASAGCNISNDAVHGLSDYVLNNYLVLSNAY